MPASLPRFYYRAVIGGMCIGGHDDLEIPARRISEGCVNAEVRCVARQYHCLHSGSAQQMLQFRFVKGVACRFTKDPVRTGNMEPGVELPSLASRFDSVFGGSIMLEEDHESARLPRP